MIEKLRELVETALDWFPEYKLASVTYLPHPCLPGYECVFETPGGKVHMMVAEALVQTDDDLFIVTEVRYQLMQEAK